MPDTRTKHILLATLGGQPQVVTYILDLLLAYPFPINEVIVVHPASYPGLQQAIVMLNAEFAGDNYTYHGQVRRIHFRRHVIRYYGRPVEDIVDGQTADGVLDTMGELIHDLKQQQYIIHLAITGGRRLMSFLSFSAALLHFTHEDRVWHLYTPEEIQQQARGGELMHVEPEAGVRLIEVPFFRAAQSILAYQLTNNAPNASTLLRRQAEQRRAEERARCQQVLDQLTPRLREVLKAFARGLDPQSVAQELSISLSTVSSHTNKLLTVCREVWPDETIRDYRSMHNKFAAYFSDE
jgi:CRISPR-associated protein Csx14